MRQTWVGLLAWLLAAASSAPAGAVTITMISGGARSTAYDGSGNSVAVEAATGSPPYSSGPISAVDGGSSATTTVTFTSAYLQLDFAHARTSSGGAAISDDALLGSFLFSVSAPVYVTISGFYTVADTGTADRATFVAQLENNFTHAALHSTNLQSNATPNESFVVGQLGGDTINSVSGATTHLLAPGTPYYLNWYAGIQDVTFGGDTGATAAGQIRFDFVPEPSTALLLASGLAALGALRSRRRSMRGPR